MKIEQEWIDRGIEIKQLREQLTAEREKVQDLLKHHARTSPVESQILLIEDLQRQLAAEREVSHNQAVALGQHIARLEDQLTAEREKVSNLNKN